MANKKIKFELTAVNKTKAAFDKVKGGLNSISSASGTAIKGIAGLGLAIGGLATAFGLVVKNSFDFIDAIGKTATRTGIATDTIQAFQLAARESGTNIEGANKALEKFARSVGDAQRGLKTMKDIFKALGVELETNDGHFKSTDQLLEEVAIGISSLGSQTQKATALANLFGRQGILLTNALEDLADKGLDAFIDRAERLGLLLSTKTIRRVEAFNDAVGVIKMQIKSFVNNISASFLPIFEKIQETIADKIEKIIADFKGIDGVAVFVQNTIIEFVAKSIEAVGKFADETAEFITNVKISFIELENQILQTIRNVIRELPRRFGDFTQEMNSLAASIIINNIELQNLEKQTTSYGDKANRIANNLRNNYLITIEDLQDGQDKFTKLLKKSNDELDRTNPINAFKDQLADVGKTLDQIAVNSMKKFEDSIVTGLQTGKLAFKDFATFVVEQLIRVAIQQLIIARLIDPFRTMLSGGKLGALREYNKLTDGDTLFNGDGGGYTGMGVRAGGLDGKGGFPAILHPNETVIDHTKGQGMGTTVNFNISTVDAAGFDQLLASRKGLITSIINNAMNNQGKMGVV
jgi:phage-related minor tail protein